MVSPANLFRMLVEMIFVLLGAFLVWIGLSERFLFDPRRPAWMVLGMVLVYWGARTWIKTTRTRRTVDRFIARLGGTSLVVVGFLMLGLSFVELRWVGAVLALAGGILVLRGLLSAILALWPH
jgi:small-conductance mechanosensitive channel